MVQWTCTYYRGRTLVWFGGGAQNKSGKIAAYGDSFAMRQLRQRWSFHSYPIMIILYYKLLIIKLNIINSSHPTMRLQRDSEAQLLESSPDCKKHPQL